MDVLIEFCRTGRLGPVALGLDAPTVEGLVGPPERTRAVQGEENRQRFSYADLSILFTGSFEETRDKASLSVDTITVTLRDRPVQLPRAISAGIERDWSAPPFADIVSALAAAGVTVSRYSETRKSTGEPVRMFRVDGTDVSLIAVGDVLWRIECTRWYTPSGTYTG